MNSSTRSTTTSRAFRARLMLLLFCSIQSSWALFTQTVRWGSVSVQRNSQGTFFYVPASAQTRATTCKDAAADFASVLQVHLAQGLSIAYYNGVDNGFLGGANYSLPANMSVIRLCVSGRAGDGGFETLCVNAVADNQLSGSPYCQVALPQEKVTDGCYDPRARRPGSPTVSGANLGSTYSYGYPTDMSSGGIPTRSSQSSGVRRRRIGIVTLVIGILLSVGTSGL